MDKKEITKDSIEKDFAVAMMSRANTRLWVLVFVLIILLAGTNAWWLYYERQFVDYGTEYIDVQQDNDNGNNNYIGNDGDIINGFSTYPGGKN